MMPRCALSASVPDWCLGDTSTKEQRALLASKAADGRQKIGPRILRACMLDACARAGCCRSG